LVGLNHFTVPLAMLVSYWNRKPQQGNSFDRQFQAACQWGKIGAAPWGRTGRAELIFTSKTEIRKISRPRTAVLELRGAFKAHPERARERAGEPRPTEPLGDPPARLKPSHQSA
jgi:hypothetical protein